MSFFFSFESLEKKNKLFTGLGSVRIVKNCDLGLENAALGLRPRAAFSRPRSQFFTIRTSQPSSHGGECGNRSVVCVFSGRGGVGGQDTSLSQCLSQPSSINGTSYEDMINNRSHVFISL